ncbi:MAG: hypothetical protein H7833_21380, partial [Magnetococcus sp. DMHC-1]
SYFYLLEKNKEDGVMHEKLTGKTDNWRRSYSGSARNYVVLRHVKGRLWTGSEMTIAHDRLALNDIDVFTMTTSCDADRYNRESGAYLVFGSKKINPASKYRHIDDNELSSFIDHKIIIPKMFSKRMENLQKQVYEQRSLWQAVKNNLQERSKQ